MLSSSTTTIIVAIGALVVPPLVSLIKNQAWSAQVKQLIAAVISLAIAALAFWLTAPSDFGLPFAQLAALVYAGSQFIYGAYFKQSAVEQVLTNVFHKPTQAAN